MNQAPENGFKKIFDSQLAKNYFDKAKKAREQNKHKSIFNLEHQKIVQKGEKDL